MTRRRISSIKAHRRWRPLAFVALWLPFVVASLLYSPLPKLERTAVDAVDADEQRLLGAFDLPAEPIMLVFHRAGGLAPQDRAYFRRIGQDVGKHTAYGEAEGETYALALASSAHVQETAERRAALQGSPDGLSTYVTGKRALAYDAAVAWRESRWLVLVGCGIVAALAALFSKFGLSRAVLVGLSASCVGAMASVLAALLAPPLTVALSTTLSAGLAGTWSIRLLSPRRPDDSPPVPAVRRGAPAQAGMASLTSPTVSRLTPLQHAIVQAGEGTLLQAFIVIAGLAGFLFNLRTGIALFLGVLVAIAFSLSGAPALIALLARPRHPRPPGEPKPHKGFRLGLAVLLAAGVFWLTPSAHPIDAVPSSAASAVGYDLLRASAIIGRAMPFHLLAQAPTAGRSDTSLAALDNLIADLENRAEIAAVEGQEALQARPGPPAPVEEWLSGREGVAGALAKDLEVQAGALATVIDVLERIPSATASPAPISTSQSLTTSLNETRVRLDEVRDTLTTANAMLDSVPIEFPEIAPRMRNVPALKALPDILAHAVADLADISADISADLSTIVTSASPQRSTSVSVNEQLAPVQAELTRSLSALEDLAIRTFALQEDLNAAEAQWASAALGDPAPVTPSPYLVSHDLIRLALVPAGDPYAPATLESASTLLQIIQDARTKGPLSDSALSLYGTPVAANARKDRHLHNLWFPGTILATLTTMLCAWGALSRAGPALRLAAGALLSSLAGVGLAAVLGPVDVGVLASAGVVVVAVAGGRMAAGWISTAETLALALPPLCLGLTGIPALATMGIVTSSGLLAGRLLVAPSCGHRRPAEME
ncbi:MAG TPA: hypothetical protein ENN19_05080 [Chloroflexi bacterium]|nr:hypothetical protein [Chloroflexota bacterium]